jgi:type VI secretion system protein VasJ
MTDLATIPQLGTSLVPGDLPVGESLKYDPDYEAVAAELAKIGTVAGGEVDWKLVAGKSASLLERSKDLYLATALAFALFNTDGWPGLKAGMEALTGMCDGLWADCYPARSRMRARVALFEWLSERVTNHLADPNRATPADGANVAACAAMADALFAACDQKRMEGPDNGLGGLVRSLRETRDRVGGGAPAAGAAPAAGTLAAGGAAPATGGGAPTVTAPERGAPLSPNGVIATREEAFRRLGELAEFFAKAEPLSPVGPLLQRASAWGRMSYKDLYQELLGQSKDAKNILWDALGIKKDEKDGKDKGGKGD